MDAEPVTVPADFNVTLGAVDGTAVQVSASFVVCVPASGVGRLMYTMQTPGGSARPWVYKIPVEEGRRSQIVATVLGCGLLEVADALSGGDRAGSGPWLAVQADGRRVWLRLGADGMFNRVPVAAAVLGVVPGSIWKRTAERRAAYLARRATGDRCQR